MNVLASKCCHFLDGATDVTPATNLYITNYFTPIAETFLKF